MACYFCCKCINPCCCIPSKKATVIISVLDIVFGFLILYLGWMAYGQSSDKEFQGFVVAHNLERIVSWGMYSIPFFAFIGIACAIWQLSSVYGSTDDSPHAWKAFFFLITEVLGFVLPFYLIEDYDDKITMITEFSIKNLSFNLLQVNPITFFLFVYQILSFWVVCRHQVITRHQRLKVSVKVHLPTLANSSKISENQIKRSTFTVSSSTSTPVRAQQNKQIYPNIEKVLGISSLRKAPSIPSRPREHSVVEIDDAYSNSSTMVLYSGRKNSARANFDKIKKKCISDGRFFEDLAFPPSSTSLGSGRAVQWKRPFEINPDAKFVTDGFSRFDVRQGELGDCWFLAALANLTLNDDLLNQVIPSDNEWGDGNSYSGTCHFRFYENGRWEEVIIDDRLPTKNGKLIYLQSSDETEFWSALIEKAYAKLNGSYARLNGNDGIRKAMLSLTGGKVDRFYLIDFKDDWNPIFQLMKESSENGMMLGVCADNGQNGIIGAHAYSVSAVETIPLKKGKQVACIRIRNPWGNEAEWKGKFSDGHPIWNFVDKKTKNELKLKFQDDGEFWFPMAELVKHFQFVEICHFN